MIQPAALPAAPGLPMLGEALSASTVEGMEGADFGALLAIEAGSLVPPGLAPKLPGPVLSAPPAALPESAVLPDGGKTLPLAASAKTAAPIASAATPIEPGSSPRVETAPQPEVGDDETPVQPEPRIAMSLAWVFEPAPTLAEPIAPPTIPAAPNPQARPPGPPALTPETALSAALVATPQTSSPVMLHSALATPGQAQSAPAAPQPAPSAVTLSLITGPVGLAPRTAGTRPRLTLPAVRSAASIAAAMPLIGEPKVRLTLPITGLVQVPDGAAGLPAEPRLVLAPTGAAERPRVPGNVTAVAPVELALAAAEPLAPAAALAAPAVLTPPAASAFAPADPALRPHDFVALVDRLVAARELAAPQAFQVAVQHGEFGQVQLRFRHEGDGLTIAMASADPDFARVVSAASAPVLLPLTTTDPSTGQGGPRSDSQSQTATSNGHSAQNRGGSPERREDRNGPADNPAPARQSEGRGTRRSGIFA